MRDQMKWFALACAAVAAAAILAIWPADRYSVARWNEKSFAVCDGRSGDVWVFVVNTNKTGLYKIPYRN